MKVLSLFSGIGGFDLGFQRAGMEVVGMCEIDKHAQKILQRRFPDATLHTDVRKVRYERRSIDLICGGFPCQDLSVAGKRRGLDGERSGLWFEFARIIDEAEPAWVVIENVPGLFSSNDGRDFAVIVDWLVQRGYGVGWRVLDAQGFGLAQRRKRVFIVASFGSPSGCTVLLEHEGLQGNPKPSRASRQGDTGATQDGTRDGVPRNAQALTKIYTLDSASSNSWKSCNPHSGIHETNVARTIDTSGTNPQANQGGNVVTFAIQGNIIDQQRGGAEGVGIAKNAPMYTLTSMDRHGVAFQQNTRDEVRLMQGDGNVVGALAASAGMKQQNYVLWHATTSIPKNAQALTTRYGNTWYYDTATFLPMIETLLWEASHGYDPARVSANQDLTPTLSAKMGTGGNNVPLIGVRRLTPTECERLQGFPDGWTDGQADTQRYKQLGNAVAVPVAEWIGRRIMEVAK